jgi:hypothetical protein
VDKPQVRRSLGDGKAMKLFEDHAFLIFLALVIVLVCYTVLVIAGKPIDERIIGIIGLGLATGLLGFANKPPG